MRALVVEIAGIPMAVVAIAIAVSKVAVAAAYVFGAVKHKCHILEYPLLVEFFNVFQTTSVHEADAYDKQIVSFLKRSTMTTPVLCSYSAIISSVIASVQGMQSWK